MMNNPNLDSLLHKVLQSLYLQGFSIKKNRFKFVKIKKLVYKAR